MGICVSVASSKIQEAERLQEIVVYPEESVVIRGVPGRGSVYSTPGCKGLNQDAAILYQGYGIEGGTLCGVFDGHGTNGHIVSKIVRNRLPSLLLSQKNDINKTTTAAGQLRNEEESVQKWHEASIVSAFKVVDKEVMLQDNLDCSASGTTAVIVIKQGDDLVIANLGDSRAILGTVTENGVMGVPLTTDLKPSISTEADRIKKCNGRVLALQEQPHIQRVWLPHVDAPGLAMSRAFGDSDLKKFGVISIPEISYRRLTPEDQFLVLATDGVWDVLSNDQVASIVWASNSEEEAAKALVDAANETWKEKFPSTKVDDCTVVCLFFKNRPNIPTCLE